jgi:hypothetical protein
VSFEGRILRDSAKVVPVKYEPPDFIINALQQTKVKCTWDENDNEREKKLTNLSQWRRLNESDFQQYLASSDSESDDDADDSKAKSIRKLLLGDDYGDGRDDSGSDRGGPGNSSEKDDFFLSNNSGDDEESEVEDEKVMTFIPSVGKELATKKKQKELEQSVRGATNTKYSFSYSDTPVFRKRCSKRL